jgi:hypothetical protein
LRGCGGNGHPLSESMSASASASGRRLGVGWGNFR